MRLRRWIGWLAVAAILLHAGTVARHNVIVFQRVAAELASEAALDAGLICHIETDEDGGGQALPGKDRTPAKPCPVCLGLASAHALAVGEVPVLRLPQAMRQRVAAPREEQRAPALKFLRPLTHAPPSLA
jgi:hypothetical protein